MTSHLMIILFRACPFTLNWRGNGPIASGSSGNPEVLKNYDIIASSVVIPIRELGPLQLVDATIWTCAVDVPWLLDTRHLEEKFLQRWSSLHNLYYTAQDRSQTNPQTTITTQHHAKQHAKRRPPSLLLPPSLPSHHLSLHRLRSHLHPHEQPHQAPILFLIQHLRLHPRRQSQRNPIVLCVCCGLRSGDG